MNRMIAVAGGATGQAFFFERMPHLGILEQFGDLAVAGAAGVGHRVHLRRSGAVIAVAVVASRRAGVALLQQGHTVDALAPLGIFVARKRLPLVQTPRHDLLVGMALRTGLGHLRVVDGRGGFVHRTNAARRQIDGTAVRLVMTGNTSGHLRIARLLQLLAMTAGPVLGKLIRTRRGIEMPHVIDVGVATAAELGNVSRRLDHPEGLFGLFGMVDLIGGVFKSRIAAVTILAANPPLPMHVVLQQRQGKFAIFVHRRRILGIPQVRRCVALDTSILLVGNRLDLDDFRGHLVGRGRLGFARLGFARFGFARFGFARFGFARFGVLCRTRSGRRTRRRAWRRFGIFRRGLCRCGRRFLVIGR